jgi:hypothetical protein
VLQTSPPRRVSALGMAACGRVCTCGCVCLLPAPPPTHTHPFPSLSSPQSVLGSRLCTTLQTLEVRSNNVSPGPHCPSRNPCQVIVKSLSSHCSAFASPLCSPCQAFVPPLSSFCHMLAHTQPPPPPSIFLSARSLLLTRALSRTSTGGGGGGGGGLFEQIKSGTAIADLITLSPALVALDLSWNSIGAEPGVRLACPCLSPTPDPCCVCVCAPRSFGCMTFPLPMLVMIDGLIWGWAGPYCGGTDKVHQHGQSAHSVQ